MARRLIGAVVLLVALAGCGGDPKADPPPSPSPPTTPSTTPVSTTPSAPPMPDAAKENSKAGAIAFVRHYVELINYAQRTGDTSALAAVEDAGCKSCENGRTYIDAIYSSGGHIENGLLRVRVVDALANASIGGWTIDGKLAFGPQIVVRPSATPTTQQLKGGSVPITMLVAHGDQDWRVVDWTRAR